MENNTLTYLYSKSRNRLAKIIYIFIYIIILLGIFGPYFYRGQDIDIYSLLLAILIFEAVRRSFYYITLGTINPKK